MAMMTDHDLLVSIDASLKELVAISRARRPKHPTVDLDGPHGDPIIKAKEPRDWTGEPMNGRRFSECPPAYLDLLVSRYDYFISNAERDMKDATDEDELSKARKNLKYATLDRGRAAGWA